MAILNHGCDDYAELVGWSKSFVSYQTGVFKCNRHGTVGYTIPCIFWMWSGEPISNQSEQFIFMSEIQ